MALIPRPAFGIQQDISRAQGAPLQQVQRSAQDFGGREAGDLQGFGNAVTGVAVQRLDIINRTLVQDASNKFRTEARDIT